MDSIQSVNPEKLKLDIREAKAAASTLSAEQSPDILRVLAVVGASSLEPSITFSSARRNNLTHFSNCLRPAPDGARHDLQLPRHCC